MQDSERRWSKCRCCGSTRVETYIGITDSADMESVLVTCKDCEKQRGFYKRKKKLHKQTKGNHP